MDRVSLLQSCLQLAGISIFGRILSPDFGLLAMLTVVTNLIGL
jgi:hypothetical protein